MSILGVHVACLCCMDKMKHEQSYTKKMENEYGHGYWHAHGLGTDMDLRKCRPRASIKTAYVSRFQKLHLTVMVLVVGLATGLPLGVNILNMRSKTKKKFRSL